MSSLCLYLYTLCGYGSSGLLVRQPTLPLANSTGNKAAFLNFSAKCATKTPYIRTTFVK